MQEIIRGGIDVRANLNYALTVQLTGSYKLYNGPFEVCLQLLHSWPDNTIDVYPYYQYRTMKWIDTGFVRIVRPYAVPGSRAHTCRHTHTCTCIYASLTLIFQPGGLEWGPKKKWELAAVTFRLPSLPSELLWSSCNPSTLQCNITKLND